MQPLTRRPTFDAAAESVANSGFSANINIQAFIKYETTKGRSEEADLRDSFDDAACKGNTISIIHRPSTSRPWYKFRTGNSDESGFDGGRQFYTADRDTVNNMSRKYGVPSELVVVIISIETNYGKNTESFRVTDALNTLAFGYPHRTEFFQDELSELLLMAKEEKTDIFSFKSSYAGAMDMPQFMPSSFHEWAVDYDDGGHRGTWDNIDDVAASVANYIKAHGWQTGGKMIVPVALNPTLQIQTIIDEQAALTRMAAGFRELDVMPMEDMIDSEKAVLYRLETSPGVYEHYLGLNSFYAVWKYNHSHMCITAVHDTVNAVGSAGL